MLDPHTAATLDLEQIRAMVDELLLAHRPLLPDWLAG
jgi:alpha-galactosidase